MLSNQFITKLHDNNCASQFNKRWARFYAPSCVSYLKITITRIKMSFDSANLPPMSFSFHLSSTCINDCLHFHILCVFSLFYHVVCSLSVSLKWIHFYVYLGVFRRKTSNNHKLIIIRLIGRFFLFCAILAFVGMHMVHGSYSNVFVFAWFHHPIPD